MKKIIILSLTAMIILTSAACSGGVVNNSQNTSSVENSTTGTTESSITIENEDQLIHELSAIESEWITQKLKGNYDYVINEFENLDDKYINSIGYNDLKDIYDECKKLKNEESSASETTNNWEIKYYVDDFNDPTDEKYASCFCTGVFSNTATTNSPLIVQFLVDYYVCIKLYEYGNNTVYNYYNDTAYYDISVKNDYGLTYSFEGSMKPNNGDRIYVNESHELKSLFKNSSQVKFHIVNRERPTSVYNFTVDTEGFDSVYYERFQ